MPDLHGWITQQIDRVENDLRGVDKEHGRNWTTRWDASSDTFTVYDDNGSAVAADFLPAVAGLVVANDPAAVLRRCAVDRELLADLLAEKHTVCEDSWYHCVAADDNGDRDCNQPCSCGRDERVERRLRLLADGYGYDEEQPDA